MNYVFLNNVASKLKDLNLDDIATQSGFDKTENVLNSVKNLCVFFSPENATKNDILRLLELYFEVTCSGYAEIDRQFVLCLIDSDLATASKLLPELKTQMSNEADGNKTGDKKADSVMNDFKNLIFKTLDVFF